MYAYPFAGYWKDVGTIDSLWEANMDLLGEEPALDIRDESWRIYSRHSAHAPQFVGQNATVENSSVTQGCEIEGCVRNSVLGSGVKVGRGAVVCDCVIFDDVVIEAGATVQYAILDSGVSIGAGAKIGAEREKATGITVLGADVKIPAKTVIADNEMISEWKGE